MPPSNLYQFYTQQGQALPSVSDRAPMYEQMGLGSSSQYKGTAEQNARFLAALQGGQQQETSNAIRSTSATSSDQARGVVRDMAADIQQPETPRTPRQQIDQGVNQLDDAISSAYGDFNDQLNAFQSGAVRLSRDEQRMLDDIQSQFDISRRRQMVANQSTQGGFATAQQMSGMSRYAPEMAAVETQRVAQEGIDRLKEIDFQASDQLSKARSALVESKVDALRESYDSYLDAMKERRNILSEMRQNLNDSERTERDIARLGLEERRVSLAESKGSLERKKLSLQITKLGKEITDADRDVNSSPILKMYTQITGNLPSSKVNSGFIVDYASSILSGYDVVPDDFVGPLDEDQIYASQATNMLEQAYGSLDVAEISENKVNQWLETPEAENMDDELLAKKIRGAGHNPEDFGIYSYGD